MEKTFGDMLREVSSAAQEKLKKEFLEEFKEFFEEECRAQVLKAAEEGRVSCPIYYNKNLSKYSPIQSVANEIVKYYLITELGFSDVDFLGSKGFILRWKLKITEGGYACVTGSNTTGRCYSSNDF
jgi:hypothetical protein